MCVRGVGGRTSLQIVHELRGPKARSTKRKSLNPDEKLPAGVYFKPESNCYQAQVSVNRRNIRGPPRQTLDEAINDRQRLLVAKAQGGYMYRMAIS